MKNNIARQIPARGANHYVRAVVLQNLLILCDGKTSKEHPNLKISLDPIALNLFWHNQGSLFYIISGETTREETPTFS